VISVKKESMRWSQRHFLCLLAGRYSAPLRRRGRAGLLSLISVAGLALSVLILIVVSSVMNGFERELQQRMLSLLPQLQLLPTTTAGMPWPSKETRQLTAALAIQDNIETVEPYLEATVMVSRSGRLHSATLTAIEQSDSGTFAALAEHIVAGDLAQLQQQRYSIAIGSLLARQLGATIGDAITITTTDITITPLGPTSRQKRFYIAAIFEVGAQPDLQQIFTPLPTGQKLLGKTGRVDGIRLGLDDPYRASETAGRVLQASALSSAESLRAINWQQRHRSLFRAVAMEKTMIFLLLLVVVAVASFNIVSIVLMTVNDKRGDIAILRTLGASAKQIQQLFIVQGLIVGASGSLIGTLLGLAIAPNSGTILHWIEHGFGWQLFDPSVYFIPYLPSQLQWGDVVTINLAAIAISLLVSSYPAARAARISPAEALAFER